MLCISAQCHFLPHGLQYRRGKHADAPASTQGQLGLIIDVHHTHAFKTEASRSMVNLGTKLLVHLGWQMNTSVGGIIWSQH